MVTGTFFNSTGSFNGNSMATMTLIGARDFLITEVRGPSQVVGAAYNSSSVQNSYTAGAGFHVEVPQRLYPQAVDPNPIVWTLWRNAQPNQVAASYYNGLN